MKSRLLTLALSGIFFASALLIMAWDNFDLFCQTHRHGNPEITIGAALWLLVGVAFTNLMWQISRFVRVAKKGAS